MSFITILGFQFRVNFLKLEVMNFNHIFMFTLHSYRNSRWSKHCQIIFFQREFGHLEQSLQYGWSRSRFAKQTLHSFIVSTLLLQERSITTAHPEHFLDISILTVMLILLCISVLLSLLHCIHFCRNRCDHIGMLIFIFIILYLQKCNY